MNQLLLGDFKSGAPKIRAAIYARVSTRDKNQNPDTQLMPCRRFCQEQGYEIVGEYIDQARAKDSVRRTAWTKLKSEAMQRRFRVVVCLRLDRPFRSVRECANTLGDWLDRGILFQCVQQSVVDTNTSSGRFITNILAAAAELESEWIGERVRDGIKRFQAEGKHFGRKGKNIPLADIITILRISPSISAAARTLECSRAYIHNRLKDTEFDISEETGRFWMEGV